MHRHICHLSCSNHSIALWLSSAVVYYSTLYLTERWSARRQAQPPLHDRSFEHLPRIEGFVYLTDGAGLVGAVGLAYWILLCPPTSPESRIAREALCYSAVGNYFSSSLHSVTLLPSSDHAAGVPAIFGGHTDKLMSNHCYHFGLYCRILVQMDLLPLGMVGPLVLVYSAMLACTRSHYAVDIVLAWWALALVFVSGGTGAPLQEHCLMDGSMNYSRANYSNDVHGML